LGPSTTWASTSAVTRVEDSASRVLRVRFHGRSSSTELVLASRLMLIGMSIGSANDWRLASPMIGIVTVGDGGGGGGGWPSDHHKGGGGGGGAISSYRQGGGGAGGGLAAASAAVEFDAAGAAVGIFRQGGVARQRSLGGECNGGAGGGAAKAELELAVDLPAPFPPLSYLSTGWRQLNGFCS
jgi:hypothetical protein